MLKMYPVLFYNREQRAGPARGARSASFGSPFRIAMRIRSLQRIWAHLSGFLQEAAGRQYLFEHPAAAKSFGTRIVQKLLTEGRQAN